MWDLKCENIMLVNPEAVIEGRNLTDDLNKWALNVFFTDISIKTLYLSLLVDF